MFINAKFVHGVDGSGLLSQDWGQRAAIGDQNGDTEFQGFVDEFYIYTKALQQDEIFGLVQACAYGKKLLLCLFQFAKSHEFLNVGAF